MSLHRYRADGPHRCQASRQPRPALCPDSGATQTGGCCYLDEEQTRLVMKSNLQFRLELPEEQLFHEYFTPATSDQEGQRMTAAAIFQEMKSKVGSSLRIANIRTFGRFLSNLDSLIRRCRRYVTEYLVAKR